MTFPKDFLWGSSTAAHQVEGNNTKNDWWRWEQLDDKRAKSGIACDHYNLYEQDFDLAKSLGHNAHRISIEWSRIVPEIGKINMDEIEHYRKVLQAQKDRGLKTFVTLWHFTNPTWFLDLGGFTKKENLKYFEDFVKICTENFADLIDFWLTINEPDTYVVKAYLIGMWPPQKVSPWQAFVVYTNLALAHKQAYKIIHESVPNAKVGFAYQLVSYYPFRNNILDKTIAHALSFLANDWFLWMCGQYQDFFGLNYYFKNPASLKYLFPKLSPADLLRSLQGLGKDVGWGMDPAGLRDVMEYAWKKFKKPIYILEHGIADASDNLRQKYIQVALESIDQVIQEGIDVRSYLHWSLMDNYEWQFGFEPRFGLAEVDFITQKRTPRRSAYLLKEMLTSNHG